MSYSASPSGAKRPCRRSQCSLSGAPMPLLSSLLSNFKFQISKSYKYKYARNSHFRLHFPPPIYSRSKRSLTLTLTPPKTFLLEFGFRFLKWLLRDSTRMERYEIGEILGGGSFAVVYQATDSSANKTIALKKISLGPGNEIPRSVMREASLLFDLQHDNIVSLERVFVYEECMYLVLEYMPMDLRVHMSWMEERYPGIVKKLLKQILSGISYCHSQGVLHRDLKPENMLIDTTREMLKITDFGFARGFLTPDLTLSPEVVTLGYRAPEILMGSDHYSTPVDMWSVGCIFAEMMNDGVPLFEGTSQIAVLSEIFRVMGTPDEVTWPGVTSLPDFPHDSATYFPQELSARVSNLEPDGALFLSKFLCLDPRKRISAQEALEDEYLQDVGA